MRVGNFSHFQSYADWAGLSKDSTLDCCCVRMRAFRAPARIGALRSLAAQRRLARDDTLIGLTMLRHSDIVRSEVVSTLSSFRFPEHKSAHLKSSSSYATQPLGG